MLSEHNVSIVQGIKGLASGVFFDNLAPSFLEVSKSTSFNNSGIVIKCNEVKATTFVSLSSNDHSVDTACHTTSDKWKFNRQIVTLKRKKEYF